jgi:CRP-like cAMP-binding protein
MLPTSQFSTRNHILNSLSEETLDRVLPTLEAVALPLGETIFRPYEKITHVYFPDTSMASIVANSESGHTTEIGIASWEGAAGLDVLLGGESSPHEAICQMAGQAHRMPTEAALEEFGKAGDFQALLLHFFRTLVVQISQTTLCNRIHSVEQRLCRWLLMCQDRSASEMLPLTQEFLSVMLGVTRVSVTIAAHELQENGCITYSRGKIAILDRAALEGLSCECYGVVKKEYDAYLAASGKAG